MYASYACRAWFVCVCVCVYVVVCGCESHKHVVVAANVLLLSYYSILYTAQRLL